MKAVSNPLLPGRWTPLAIPLKRFTTGSFKPIPPKKQAESGDRCTVFHVFAGRRSQPLTLLLDDLRLTVRPQ